MLWLFGNLILAETISTNSGSTESVQIDIPIVVETKIVEEISNRLDISKNDITVEYLGLGNTRRCVNADYVDVTIPDREDFNGPITTSVVAYKEGSICGKWTIRPKVAIWDMLPVATKNISAGEIVVFEYRKHRRDRLMMNPASELDNMIAKTQISEDSVILWNQVRVKPDNFDGDSVVLFYNSGNLLIKTNGTLMSDAFIGDTVKVISEGTNTVLWGLLREPGVVYIQGGRE
jgi:flagella basal body P-ring formation protein FlgA